MCLLMTLLAAIGCTAIWYWHDPENKSKTGLLCWMYWGAAILWSVDLAFEYATQGAAVFTPAPVEMLQDAFLGAAVITFGLLIWMIDVLVTDPRGVVRAALRKK